MVLLAKVLYGVSLGGLAITAVNENWIAAGLLLLATGLTSVLHDRTVIYYRLREVGLPPAVIVALLTSDPNKTRTTSHDDDGTSITTVDLTREKDEK